MFNIETIIEILAILKNEGNLDWEFKKEKYFSEAKNDFCTLYLCKNETPKELLKQSNIEPFNINWIHGEKVHIYTQAFVQTYYYYFNSYINWRRIAGEEIQMLSISDIDKLAFLSAIKSTSNDFKMNDNIDIFDKSNPEVKIDNM